MSNLWVDLNSAASVFGLLTTLLQPKLLSLSPSARGRVRLPVFVTLPENENGKPPATDMMKSAARGRLCEFQYKEEIV